MCERCEEAEQDEQIMKSFKEKKTDLGCSKCSLPIQKKNIKLEDQKENMKLVEESIKDARFHAWQKLVNDMSKQLKDCILSGMSYAEKMKQLYDQLGHCDLLQDKSKIVEIMKMIRDYGRMAQVNDSVVKETAELILSRSNGNQ